MASTLEALLGALQGSRVSRERRQQEQAAEQERRRQEAQEQAARIAQQQQSEEAAIVRLALQDPVTFLEAGGFEDPRSAEVLSRIGINAERLAGRAERLRSQGQQAKNLETVKALIPLAQQGVVDPLLGSGGGQAMPPREGVQVPEVGGTSPDLDLGLTERQLEALREINEAAQSQDELRLMTGLGQAVGNELLSPDEAADKALEFGLDMSPESFERVAPKGEDEEKVSLNLEQLSIMEPDQLREIQGDSSIYDIETRTLARAVESKLLQPEGDPVSEIMKDMLPQLITQDPSTGALRMPSEGDLLSLRDSLEEFYGTYVGSSTPPPQSGAGAVMDIQSLMLRYHQQQRGMEADPLTAQERRRLQQAYQRDPEGFEALEQQVQAFLQLQERRRQDEDVESRLLHRGQ